MASPPPEPLLAEEEQLLSAPKEENQASEEARRIAQEEDEKLFLHKGPLFKKLAEIIRKCNLKNISSDVVHCLSMCVEERLRRFINTLIRVSKQRMVTEKTGHRLVITSDVGQQILRMNQKTKKEWYKKQAEETDKNKKQNEVDASGRAELDKEKEETSPKNAKAVGGSDMLSKWQLMAKQARQKHEGIHSASDSQHATAPRPLHMLGKGPSEHHEASNRTHSAAFGTGLQLTLCQHASLSKPKSNAKLKTDDEDRLKVYCWTWLTLVPTRHKEEAYNYRDLLLANFRRMSSLIISRNTQDPPNSGVVDAAV